ncbi:MAG: YchJ family protein [Gammaproteobacteria bacterium]|jgi:SEC-C motif-containing protein|nr:YchJ family protein [Gammaproteobacteria bacterium]
MTHCPCGSQKTYAECCGKFLNNSALPATPEELMRSRYTAFTKGNVDYIAQTQQGTAATSFNAEETRRWAKRAKWLDLNVIKVYPVTEDQGFVEFVARYSSSNKIHHIHEKSEFQKIDGRWYYVDSHHPGGCGSGCSH